MRGALFALVLASAACSGDAADPDPGDGPVHCPDSGRYLPLVTGTQWTYRVTNDGERTTKISTVGDLEDVGGAKAGVLAYRVSTVKAEGGEADTVSWQEDTGTALRRHRELDMTGTHTEEWYQPYKLRLDESADHVSDGATWSESYVELVKREGSSLTTSSDKTEAWVVEAVDDVVAVPAGRFCALRVRRTSAVGDKGGSDKTYWFVRGIGKVKETGGKTEELVEYRIPQAAP